MSNVHEFLAGKRDSGSPAFQYLFEKHSEHISRFIGTILTDKEDIQDMLVHTFQRLWESNKTFETEEKLVGFLMIVSRNFSYNLLRDRKRGDKRITEFLLHQDKIQHPTVDLPVEEELMNKIYQSIEQLPPRQKLVIQMVLFEGLNDFEIAKKLERSAQTIHNLKSQAFQCLAKHIRPALAISLMYIILRFA